MKKHFKSPACIFWRFFVVLVFSALMATCGDFELWVDEEDAGGNSVPTASFTYSPRTVLPCSETTVTFNGSGSSDPDNDTLLYGWSLTGPLGSSAELTSTSSSSTSLTPDVPGEYAVTLTVFDGQLFGVAPKTITVSSDPIAVAALAEGAKLCLNNGITLDGSGSMDPGDSCGNSSLTYAWELVESSIPVGATATLSGETTARPTFQTDTLGQYLVILTVQNGESDEDTQTLLISVDATADAGEDQDEAVRGVEVGLDGSNSTNPLTCDASFDSFSWEIIDYPGETMPTLNNSTSLTPSFTPEDYGIYIIRLTVTEAANSFEDENEVTVTVPIRAGDYTISLESLEDTIFNGILESFISTGGVGLSQTMTIPSLTEIEAAGDNGYQIDDYPLQYGVTDVGILDLVIKRQAGSVNYTLSGSADIGGTYSLLGVNYECHVSGTISTGSITPRDTEDLNDTIVDISVSLAGVTLDGNGCVFLGAPNPAGAINITMEGVLN